MAVDMSNVKQIMHNNKEVIKIEDSLGHIIWQKKKTTVTTTITWTGSNILNKVYTVSNASSDMDTLTFVSLSKFKNAIATQLGISSSDIISISDYQWQNYWRNGVGWNNSTSTVMWKTSDSSSGADWFSKKDNRTSSSSTAYIFTITKTPSWGSTLYAWFRYTIGSYNYGPYDCSNSNVVYPEWPSLSNWKFSFTVTYNK